VWKSEKSYATTLSSTSLGEDEVAKINTNGDEPSLAGHLSSLLPFIDPILSLQAIGQMHWRIRDGSLSMLISTVLG
jgi:hypothetical protein